jgi:hypothetical protein
VQLRKDLFKKVEYFKENKQKKVEKKAIVKYYINQKELISGAIIDVEYKDEVDKSNRTFYRVLTLDFSMFNSSDITANLPDKVTIYSNLDLKKYPNSRLSPYEYLETPEGQSVFSLDIRGRLYSEDWLNEKIQISYRATATVPNVLELEIKIYNKNEILKIPCKLKISN